MLLCSFNIVKCKDAGERLQPSLLQTKETSPAAPDNRRALAALAAGGERCSVF
jgi:hypothetical protein